MWLYFHYKHNNYNIARVGTSKNQKIHIKLDKEQVVLSWWAIPFGIQLFSANIGLVLRIIPMTTGNVNVKRYYFQTHTHTLTHTRHILMSESVFSSSLLDLRAHSSNKSKMIKTFNKIIVSMQILHTGRQLDNHARIEFQTIVWH